MEVKTVETFKEDKTRLERLVDGILAHKIIATAFLVSLGALFWFNYISLPSRLPQSVEEFIILVVIGAILSYKPSEIVVERLWDKNLEVIHRVNATEEVPIRSLKTGKGNVRQLDISGEPSNYVNYRGETGFIVRKIDLEEGEAEASQLGELSDVELLTARENIEKYRHKGNELILRGKYWKHNFLEIIREIEASYFSKQDDRAVKATDTIAKEINEKVEETVKDRAGKLDSEDSKEQKLFDEFDIDSINVTKEAKSDEQE